MLLTTSVEVLACSAATCSSSTFSLNPNFPQWGQTNEYEEGWSYCAVDSPP